jgi:hypothetical protein
MNENRIMMRLDNHNVLYIHAHFQGKLTWMLQNKSRPLGLDTTLRFKQKDSEKSVACSEIAEVVGVSD